MGGLRGPINGWEFYKNHIHKQPNLDLIPTANDLDETKFPALEKLFQQLLKFNKEMSSAGIGMMKEHDTDRYAKGYLLTDKEFQDPYPVSIQFFTKLLDPTFDESFTPNHTIYLRISQSFHYTDEARDQLLVVIRYLPTTPFHWGSCWEHCRWDSSDQSIFHEINLQNGKSPGYAHLGGYDYAWNFRTNHFNDAVNFLISATDRLIERKEHLVETAPAEYRVKLVKTVPLA